MLGRILLDANIVIALFAGDQSILERLRRIREIFLPSTVLGELCYGARKSGRVAANLARLEEFAGSVVILPCDAATAWSYGRLKEDLRSKGRPIPDNDIWIAALALQYGLPLATRDVHFNGIDGLILESW
jgi:tRNA(fMet)-specific endonuclease VapC